MVRVVQMGLGPIGLAVAARARQEPEMELVGAVDPDPRLAGQDLGTLLGQDKSGIEVATDIAAVVDTARPDVVLHATGSFLEDVAPQFGPVLDRGVSLVSTCEELAYPFYRHPRLSRTLDDRARRAGAVLLGSGVNPGFVMDKFVVTLMAACETVRGVRVVRVVDAATRRGPFQKKIGAGTSCEEFERRKVGGRMGHIGLVESAHMLADAMGAGRERSIARDLRPIVAERGVSTDHVTVEPGQVAGVHETVVLEAEGSERVRMELDMFVGAPNPRDAVVIEGLPGLEVEICSGLAGDAGTVAVVASCAPLLRELEPGLRTMLDVPLVPPTAPRGMLRTSLNPE
jgi:4-hydroxy-tetrahydrodipicolinate reductase